MNIIIFDDRIYNDRVIENNTILAIPTRLLFEEKSSMALKVINPWLWFLFCVSVEAKTN